MAPSNNINKAVDDKIDLKTDSSNVQNVYVNNVHIYVYIQNEGYSQEQGISKFLFFIVFYWILIFVYGRYFNSHQLSVKLNR